MSSKKFFSDLDGVFFDFMGALSEWHEVNLLQPDDWYDPAILDYFEKVKYNVQFWESVFIYPHVYDLLDKFDGFLTHRPKEGHKPAIDKIIPYITKNQEIAYTTGSKIPELKKRGVTHYLEDNQENFILCNAQGITCYLLRRPWNYEFHDHPLAVDTIQEALNRYNDDNGSGSKYDGAKVRPSLIPVKYIEGTARVFEFGAKKYDKWNWTKGIEYSRLIDATLRHVLALSQGEDKDSESNEYHEYHASCCLAMLNGMRYMHPELDDRPDFYKDGYKSNFLNE